MRLKDHRQKCLLQRFKLEKIKEKGKWEKGKKGKWERKWKLEMGKGKGEIKEKGKEKKEKREKEKEKREKRKKEKKIKSK